MHVILLICDLIDTQWNVNLDDYGWGTTVEMDLIDTQWNVNDAIQRRNNKYTQGFNRYIVECKSKMKCVLY